MASVEFKNIVKRFGGHEILKDVSLTIADKEFLVLVGPSGCGKSTLLRMLAGLEEATEGEILIDGKRVNHLPPRDREIAMVFQDYALYPHMSVEENMSFGLRLRGLPKEDISRRVAEAAATLQITALLKRTPRQLSGGQRQRVAIGRAIVRKPKVFLFDEPLSNLDAKLREEMRVEIAKLHLKLAATILYVTHDQVEAMTLADRIAIVDAGRLQQEGRPAEVFARPRNRFVGGFIGSPAMNFIEGEFEPGGGKPRFRAKGGEISLAAGSYGAAAPAVLGVRPEAISVEAGGVPAEVEVVELLGYRKHVHLALGGSRVLASVPASFDGKPGDQVGLRFDPAGLHLFDRAAGDRLG